MQIIKRNDVSSFITKDKSEIRELYRSEAMSLAEAVVNAGETTEYHYHNTSAEIYYIVEGNGMMEIEGEEQEVSKDQAIIIPRTKKHRIRNLERRPLRFLCLCTPPYDDEDTVLMR